MKKIQIITLILFTSTLFVGNLKSQDPLIYKGLGRKMEFGVETGLFSGYGFGLGTKDTKKSHIFEIGIWRSKYVIGHKALFRTIYGGNDFILIDSKLFFGPKIGGYIGFFLFVVGAELIYYSNFKQSSLMFAPYYGFGGHPIQLTLKPLIKLTDHDFDFFTGAINLGLTIQIASLKKKARFVY